MTRVALYSFNKKQDIERAKRLNEFSVPKVEKILVEAGSAPRGLTVASDSYFPHPQYLGEI